MDARSKASGALSFCVRGSGGFYKAVCPELQVAGTGESREEATDSLFESAKLTAKHILKTPGDKRGELATIVLQHWGDLRDVFDEREILAD